MNQARSRTVRTLIDHRSELGASTEEVFRFLSDIPSWPSWPSWVPGLLAIRRWHRGPICVGETFLMSARLRPGVVAVAPCTLWRFEPTRIAWGGGFAGAVVEHSFTLTAVSPVQTAVHHHEYASGWLAHLAAPIAALAHRYDLAWSRALEARFPAPARATSSQAVRT